MGEATATSVRSFHSWLTTQTQRQDSVGVLARDVCAEEKRLNRSLDILHARGVRYVTFSGGEPMQQAEALLELMREIRRAAPTVSLGMFTGYTESELTSGQFVTRLGSTAERRRELWRAVRELLDFAVMGRYDQTQPAIAPLRTSRNQRLELFSSRYQEGDFGPQLVEISIEESGKSVLTGFPVLGVPA